VLAIHQSDAVLARMDDWNQKQHGESGLIARVRASTVDEREAEARTLEFLSLYVPKGKSPMCGNSICQDRRFLARCMPELEAYFHYRNLDVSTLKELARRWYPERIKGFGKTASPSGATGYPRFHRGVAFLSRAVVCSAGSGEIRGPRPNLSPACGRGAHWEPRLD
jgi:oligoribonuclease (3'-5' exoribonuclease)